MTDAQFSNNLALPNSRSVFPQNWNLQKLIDASPIGITRVTLEGTILYANAAFVRMFEVPSLSDLIGQNIVQFYEHPEIRENILEQLKLGHTVDNLEVTLHTMRGKRLNTLLNLILDGDLLSSMVLDITDRKAAETEVHAMMARLKILADASKAFAEASTDYNQLLQVISKVTAQKIQGGCVIRLVSADGEWLEPLAFHDIDPDAQAMMQSIFADNRVHINDALPGALAFRTGQPVFTPYFDWQRLRPIVRPQFWPLFDNISLFTTVAAPLLAQGKSIGALFLYRHNSTLPAFDEYDLSITQDLADRAATAISHARLFKQVQHELAERKRIEAQISAATTRLQILADASRIFVEVVSDYQTLLAKITRTISHAMHASTIVRMLSEDKQWLNAVAASNIDLQESEISSDDLIGNVLSVNDAHMCAQAFRSGQALLDVDVNHERYRASLHKDFHAAFDQHPVRSIIVVPLLIRCEVIGTLAIYRTDIDQPALTTLDLQLAQDLADRAAMAIMNARLFQEVQQERALLAQRVDERTADLSLANAQLSQAMRLKDDFLASMSHELRTPLNSILGRTEATLEEIYGPLTPQQIKSLRGVEESGHHLLNLINDILDVAKIDSGVLKLDYDMVHVDVLCTTCVRMVAQTAQQKQIKIITTVDTTTEFVYADQRRLQQILVNHLSNAVKFTPSGAGNKVGLEVVGDEGQQTLTFTVWDTGIGIAQQDLPKLFKPFVQIDSSLTRQYAGTGLGLALVLRLAEAHQGSVKVESEVGKGSRFSVILPWNNQQIDRSPANGVSPNPLSAIYSIARTDNEQRLSAARILLVEDNATNVDVIQDYLQRKGYTVFVARNGAEALLTAQECQPQIILMDIQMPVMDGLQAIQEIRKIDALNHVPIIALTALAMPGDRERCLTAGASDYLTKPIDLGKLVQTIEAQVKATSR